MARKHDRIVPDTPAPPMATLHTMRKLTISFGLLNVPVAMSSPVEDEKSALRQLHAKCAQPIKMPKMCGNDKCDDYGKDLTSADIVKGFERTPGDFIVLADDDMADLYANGENAMPIDMVIDADKIQPHHVNATYYLGPGSDLGNSLEQFAILRDTLAKGKHAAIIDIVMSRRRLRAAIVPNGAALMMLTLRPGSGVRDMARLKHLGNVPAKSNPEYVKMAGQILGPLYNEHFSINDVKDTYADDLRAMIETKAKAQPVISVAPTKKAKKRAEPAQNDIAAMLAASIAAGKKGKEKHA